MFIHGGMTFKNKIRYTNYLKTRPISIEKKVRWSDGYLDEKLGDKFQMIRPRMPMQEDAKYPEWKIHFERHFPYLRRDIILIGSSLGGIFLAKWLSENKFPKKILSVYLICPPFDDTLPEEDLAGGFRLHDDLSMMGRNCRRIYLLFSRDDNIVPLSHGKKYARKLKGAKLITFESKNGHFKIARFPEIVRMIKEDAKTISKK